MTTKRVQFNNIVQNQLPGYVKSDYPLVAEFLKSYFKKFPEIKDYMNTTINFCRKNGYVNNIFGRRCHIPSINDKNYLTNTLGPKKYFKDTYEDNLVAGVVTGLAWTSVGGEILFIESSVSPGKGDLNITGNLGKIMKESAIIAMEYIKSNAKELGIDNIDFGKFNSPHPQIFHAGYFDLQVAIFKLFALVWDVSEYFQNKPRYSIVFAFRKGDS